MWGAPKVLGPSDGTDAGPPDPWSSVLSEAHLIARTMGHRVQGNLANAACSLEGGTRAGP